MIDEKSISDVSFVGENDDIFCYGEEEDCYEKRESGISELDNQLQIYHSELCEQFRQILSDRQELRRKNIFLQKKMVEFFKRRKMDHVLKEDPKGLDLESKYLKRLSELEDSKKEVVISREHVQTVLNTLQHETSELQERVKSAETDFYQRQRNIASNLKLKSKRSISTKAISSFVAAQASNAAEVHRHRFLEIKEKRMLEEKQALSQTLDSLGKGIRRADYELLQFEYDHTLRLYKEKAQGTNLLEEKITALAENLNKENRKAELFRKYAISKTKQCEKSEMHMIEVRQRLQKLKKMTNKLRKEEKELKARSGLLSHPVLLKDFENGLDEIKLLQSKLEKVKIGTKNTKDVESCSGGLAEPSHDDTSSDCSTDDISTY